MTTFYNKKVKITESREYKAHGKTWMKADSTIWVTGDNVIIDGFNFKETTSDINIKVTGNNCIIRNCHFYNHKQFKHIILVQGKYCQIHNCRFENITTQGTCIFVQRRTHREDNARIFDNIFENRRLVQGIPNGNEIIRIGTSHNSLSNSKSEIYGNKFMYCQGEIETISIKACCNVIHHNSFFHSRTITLRHGNNNLVYENEFVKNKGAIRICGENHEVCRNTFYHVIQEHITLLSGNENLELNGYSECKNINIHDNVILS